MNRFLDHLADTVHKPWIDHFLSQHPNGWVEFSDASGSPFFIGPQNCKDIAIRSIQRLIEENPWGRRVYDANYRGDYVTQAAKRNSSSSRRRSPRKNDTARQNVPLFMGIGATQVDRNSFTNLETARDHMTAATVAHVEAIKPWPEPSPATATNQECHRGQARCTSKMSAQNRASR